MKFRDRAIKREAIIPAIIIFYIIAVVFACFRLIGGSQQATTAQPIRTYRSQGYGLSTYDAEDILDFLGHEVYIEYTERNTESKIIIVAGAIKVSVRHNGRLVLVGKTKSRTTFIIPIDQISSIERIFR